ncbi:MAG TPA: phosphoribosylaminoimidazolesuccinocarboxamide synthase [Candidatus Deferrimicrobiaceae bacterium]|nr:phosphoribosylaminoimidazolesuccinocarboxamide synthase [Candidatus Deferrimicrobiaceae bacterium]
MLTADRFVRSGKVRDLYQVGPDRLLLVASDRISAFDVVLPTPIPDKGRVLTGLSRFWFGRTEAIIPNHLVGTDPQELALEVAPPEVRTELRGRMMLCRRAAVLPVEIVVRGYVSGSGWKEYQAGGAICGVALPPGLRESDRLPEPILTPATKAPVGEHDINVDFESMVQILADWAPNDDDWLGDGRARTLAQQARDAAIRLYELGVERCAEAGIILADTKFEMGLVDGELILVDEVLTPDSSRFWDAAAYQPGGPQPSFDKQFVRDWLETQPWAKTAPGPDLPADVVTGTRARYVEAFERITGGSFARYLVADEVPR